MENLNKAAIFQLLGSNFFQLIELELHQEINSTNTYLLNQPLADKVKICLAESQSEGRGRHGKQWHSPVSSNLYLSFAHRLKKDISTLSGLSLVIGITLAETLQKYCQKSIQVKWPNDLLVDGKKLSGILIEIKNENNGFCKIITGLGINIEMPENVAKFISQPSIDLNQCFPFSELSRNEIAADIITNILSCVKKFETSGFDDFYQKWNELDAWYEQQVVLEVGSQKIKGTHKGIDLSGALLLEVDGKVTSWSSGEVSLRSAN